MNRFKRVSASELYHTEGGFPEEQLQRTVVSINDLCAAVRARIWERLEAGDYNDVGTLAEAYMDLGCPGRHPRA